MAAKQPETLRSPAVNDPCPCGSGKKYKHCHGAPAPVIGAADGVPYVPAAVYLGIAEKALAAGRLPEAQTAYLAVLHSEPGSLDALLGMAVLAEGAGDDAASRHYHSRLEHAHPRNPRALYALGNFFAKRFDFARARANYRQALEQAPTLAGAWNNLGNVEKYLGNIREGIACYDRAVAADPGNASLHSAALISLYCDSSLSHEDLFARHAAWADRHAAGFYPRNPRWPNPKDPERRLRLGYVSEGFDGRVLGHFLRNVIPHHDRQQFSTYAYSGTRQPDLYTAELRGSFDYWREIRALDDEAVAAQVREDAIDILVDLDGHTPDTRLLVFARKPAPIQVTWLGYWNTTGMRTVDYIVTDPFTTPEDSPQRFSEAPLRLSDSRICYAPVPYAPAVSSLPCAERSVFTFGSFNRYDKLGPELIDCWAEILRQVPASRLIIKNSAIAIPYARAELSRRFVDLGIVAERVELRQRSPHAAMLAEYGDVDLGLDTFPYNGGLTTCEALWQGVPIVAIEGERMISRQTSAMLRLLGAEDLIARTRDEYVALAVRWARDKERLGSMRQSLRERMRASPLCDGPRFARNLEAVLRESWQAYCA
jgi:predicted O-linked N-acetylglucosamine transferase (SPINDLY family)